MAATRARRATTALSAGSRELQTRLATFERFLTRAVRERAGGPGRLGQALRYAALSPGKRLRPLLVLTACEAVGGEWKRALPAAVAVECVHAFSLVHDDLPAMDDDDYRRGRLTTHKKFGEALGVLTGDA
jgi:geranylgeranyl diphosphate synthase type II